MDRRTRWVVVAAVVVAVVVLTSLGGSRWLVLFTWWGGLTGGLFIATAALALFTYWERRDPTMLLVGVGSAGVELHALFLLVVSAIVGRATTYDFLRLWSFAYLTQLLVLAGTLLLVVPWRDRRGQPPLSVGKVVGATIAAYLGLDLLGLLAGPASADSGLFGSGLNALGWIALGALVVLGIVVTAHSLTWKGRFAWVAAAGLALAVFGSLSMLATRVSGQLGMTIVGTWSDAAPSFAAAFLGAFVLAGLQLETSRMRRATDRATEVMEGRAEIASMVAHDVRGPVSTIKGLATTTRVSYERLGDAERLEFVGMIEQEASRLLALVNQTALALKVDAETLEYDLHPRPLPPMLAEAIEQVDAGEHTVTTDVQGLIVAPADSRWFVEAVRQGVENAVKYSPPDAPITVRLRAEDADAVVEIVDAGPGIPVEQREEVFRRFTTWRPDGYEDRPGSALGLFIVRGIARGHGGDASLAEAPGGGTILRIRLPREAQPA
ncbi:MAG: sensor histidine kinase [Actinomycetota bacterium]